MLNAIWAFLILVAILCGAWLGNMEAVTQESVMAAKAAVTLSLGLLGIMAFWLGIMNIAREAGLLRWLARAIRPLMTRLFPDVPGDHPAMSMMIMNMSANMLGLGNAATPFGLKSMMELDKLNPHKGTATNAMSLFLAINTSSVALLPTGVIAVRAAMGSQNATGIIFTTFFATLCSTAVAISIAKLMQRLPRYQLPPAPEAEAEAEPTDDSEASPSEEKVSPQTVPGAKDISSPSSKASHETATSSEKRGAAGTSSSEEAGKGAGKAVAGASEDDLPEDDEYITEDLKAEVAGSVDELEPPAWGPWLQWLFWGGLAVGAAAHIAQEWLAAAFAYVGSAVGGPQAVTDALAFPEVTFFGLSRDIVSFWLLPIIMAAFLLYGIGRGVKVYNALVEGAKEGFDVAVRIIPYLVAILVAIGMFRASGALDLLIGAVGPWIQAMGMPPDALPMALMRPLSGSGAFGIMADTMQAHGTDSLVGYMVSTFQGSTETTFYVMALYFGVVQIKRMRHTLVACLAADFVGIVAAVWICRVMFG